MLAGTVGYLLLPVAPMPSVDIPTVVVETRLPGASPDTLAETVATPLEATLGRIAGLNEMTSYNSQGLSRVVLQFDLSRSSNAALRDVQAAVNAARSQLPANLPSAPSFRKYNPADQPIIELALMSGNLDRGALYDLAATLISPKIAQVEGVGLVEVGGSSLPAVRIELNPTLLAARGIGLDEHLPYQRADHRLMHLGHRRQEIAHEVHSAALPAGGEDLGNGGLQSFVGIGDNQLDAAEPPLP